LNPAIKNAREIIREEIKYLSGFYPYNIAEFVDPALLYASSMLVFRNPSISYSREFLKRVVSLAAGIELLATGTSLHNFNMEDLTGIQEINSLKSEKNYTVRLLFGDVFYSRAVIYILEYGDFSIFNSILESLKSAHKNRLSVYRKLVEIFSRGKNGADDFKGALKNGAAIFKTDEYEKKHSLRLGQVLEENELLFAGTGSLLKTSFFIGWGIFSTGENQKLPYDIINSFVLLKTLNDLSRFFLSFPGNFQFLKNIPYIEQKISMLRSRINEIASSGFEPSWLEAGIRSLEKLY